MNRMAGLKAGALALSAIALVGGGFASAGAQQGAQQLRVRPLAESPLCLDYEARQTAANELAAAIRAAVQALPNSRSSVQDIEATILYVIGQRQLCSGVARLALASLTGGTPQFLEAVGFVRTSLIDTPTGTAGIVNNGFAPGFTQFTAPIVGLGGGTANYTR